MQKLHDTARPTRSIALGVAGLVFLSLLGCKQIKRLARGNGESSCADFAACQKSCSEDDDRACVKLGDLHRKEPHGVLSKWDPDAAKQAYDKACKAENQRGCAELASMNAYTQVSSYEQARAACEAKVGLGCAVANSILDKGREFPDGKIAADQVTARTQLEAQCTKGMPESCVTLGGIFYFDSDAVNRARATQLLRTGCDKGVVNGCFYLGAFIETDPTPSSGC